MVVVLRGLFNILRAANQLEFARIRFKDTDGYAKIEMLQESEFADVYEHAYSIIDKFFNGINGQVTNVNPMMADIKSLYLI